jgi:hypothetical protein
MDEMKEKENGGKRHKMYTRQNEIFHQTTEQKGNM